MLAFAYACFLFSNGIIGSLAVGNLTQTCRRAGAVEVCETNTEVATSLGRLQCPFYAMMQEYEKAIHSDRFILSMGVQTGLADRLVGIISAFYIAILSHRSLKLIAYDHIPSFSAAFQHHYVDWLSLHSPIPKELFDRFLREIEEPFVAKRKVVRLGEKYSMLNLVNSDTTNFKLQNFSVFPADGHSKVKHLLVASNRGFVHALFTSNKNHASHLQSLGLSKDNAFACAFHFLFRPNKKTSLHQLKKVRKKLGKAKTLKIGIHIRAGDDAFRFSTGVPGHYSDTLQGVGGDIYTADMFDEYFQCAEAIENSHKTPGQKVLWYVLSDSYNVRVTAVKRFGKRKIVSDLRTPPSHIDCRFQGGAYCDMHSLNASLVFAAAEMLLFSQADYHVVPANSGYGRIAALLGTTLPKVYMIRWYLDFKSANRCEPGYEEDYQALTESMAGV